MAFQTFTLTDATDESPAVTVAVGESVRVRFTDIEGSVTLDFIITGNGFTSAIRIDEVEAWVTAAVAEGDVCKVTAAFRDGIGTISGIIETF